MDLDHCKQRSKIEKVPCDVWSKKSGKITTNVENYWSQRVEHMQVPNGTGPDVRRSERPLLACPTRRKCYMEATRNSVKGQVR